MGETAGKAVSPTEAKQGLGRTSFRRPQRDHQGQPADPTAFEALQRASKGMHNPPTQKEMEDLFAENPSSVRVLRAAGLSDEQIYRMLDSHNR